MPMGLSGKWYFGNFPENLSIGFMASSTGSITDLQMGPALCGMITKGVREITDICEIRKPLTVLGMLRA